MRQYYPIVTGVSSVISPRLYAANASAFVANLRAAPFGPFAVAKLKIEGAACVIAPASVDEAEDEEE